MKLHLSRADGLNLIKAYEDDSVRVNGIDYAGNLVVLPEQLLQDWTLATAETLTADDLRPLLDLQVEVILLGTGPRLRFPPPQLLQPFLRQGIGIEVMDRPAACRTYNLLASEGRKVAAALLIA
ncbi:Mth938-like domain-containing protein [Azonexus hydrophilus]|uniref:Mth938-like domain-containing protein n=1 Tax=Azonexus hydrophilus TaxID=418702 RepID=UPI00196416B9|nr:Mth938-like domain-containing protein [Azonexus hydrophilus]